MKSFNRRSFFRSAGIAALPVLGPFTSKAQTAPVPRVENDVVYGKGGDMDLHLDIYHPPAGITEKRMGVLHLHAGGFTAGNKS